VVVVPLTSNTGRQYPGEALVTVVGKQGKAMADQIMAAEKGRLKSRVDVLSQDGHVGDRGCHLDSFGHAEMIRRSEIAARAG